MCTATLYITKSLLTAAAYELLKEHVIYGLPSAITIQLYHTES